MTGIVKKRSVKTGLLPGSLIHIGEKKESTVKIRCFEYNEERCVEKSFDDMKEYEAPKDKGYITWLNVSGVHQVEAIERIGEIFHLHPLLLEDTMNTDQRPKLEDYGDYLFIVAKTISFHRIDEAIKIEQISIVLGPDYVITFEEGDGDIFDVVRERVSTGKGRIRKMAADYLAYSLIDVIVDNYFTAMEEIGEKIETLEDELVTTTGQTALRSIQHLKREMIFLRRSIWPLREVMASLERGETCLISEQTHVYMRDIYDHVIQVMDSVDTFRDMLSGMLDIYLSSVSNRLNEVMKVLTIIATIFMPLTFIAGVYGMNFKFMPELNFRWGYPAILLLMAGVAVYMVEYFRKKKWF
ncbi:MAG: magnesium and cobalt transport protein CorA [Syntrophus sp. (in: bacteria)]|nr:magnesium and cobalt transport protein CorA [Syntrophus sp. (in: bacteria)]